jgi:hypothetical protein
MNKVDLKQTPVQAILGVISTELSWQTHWQSDSGKSTPFHTFADSLHNAIGQLECFRISLITNENICVLVSSLKLNFPDFGLFFPGNSLG